MEHIQKLSSRLHVYFLIAPIYLRLIAPEGLEFSLTTNILGYSFFLPEICFFLLPFVAPLSLKTLSKNYYLILLTFLGIFLGYLSAVNGGSYQVVNNFLAGTDFYSTLLVFLFFPLKKENVKFLLKPTLVLATIIGLQIILYSFGFLSYEKDLSTNDGFSGISRISTTIAASTGTAVAFFLMNIILYTVIPDKLKKAFILIAVIVGSITLTRSVMIANIILLFFIFKRDKRVKLNKNKKVFRFLGIIVLLIGLIFSLNKIGILDSITSRNDSLESGNIDVSNGRFSRWESSFVFFNEYPILGTGANFVTMHKRARYAKVDSKNLFSPHNAFVLVLMERGVVGIVVFILIMYLLIRPIKRKDNSVLKITLLLSAVIFMNTEIVILFSEFGGLFFIIWNLSKIPKLNS
ncbi:O-antigen ligase [Polaribacter sp. AHE13PA]|uniref:O-antigen ligase family protein n=1 Tax=Polaribacter sp. AHE13PA TaxID=2745562 RepID=UPI001C4F3613|nr:O-antigen ligase family protein [Polaribacter sp. AHE13PA]QXP66970.1 O-antigen ligase family protein [Polaribacter sp. AHE13PA]